jgi:predicted PurR-regulated permease PerM
MIGPGTCSRRSRCYTIAAVAFLARATLVVFVLALLFAYLLEPLVGWLERRLTGTRHARGFAIATVYIVATVMIAAGAYFIAPNLVEETRRICASLSAAVARVKGTVPEAQANLVAGTVARAAGVGARAVHDVAWLLAVPIIAIFFLGNRAGLIDGIADLFDEAGNGAAARRMLQLVDRTLAEYARGQLILAALSGLFYSVTMALLGFPYPLLLGIVGGTMEFIPALGWVLAAITILISGAAAHAHWVSMAVLLAAWRLVQDFVNFARRSGDHRAAGRPPVLCSGDGRWPASGRDRGALIDAGSRGRAGLLGRAALPRRSTERRQRLSVSASASRRHNETSCA